jgi:replication initiation and membrane attachment protein
LNSLKKQLNKNDLFYVKTDGFFGITNINELVDLYLPVIGDRPFALYLKLFSFIGTSNIHQELFELLDISTEKNFLINRKKLEAVGLLKTTLLEKQVTYQLKKPLNGEDFFRNEILYSLLLHKIGELYLNKIKDRYFTKNEYGIDISANVQDAFGKFELVKVDSKDLFNYDLIRNRLLRSGIDGQEILLIKQIVLNQHELFGLDENVLAQLLIDAKDSNGKINKQLFVDSTIPKTMIVNTQQKSVNKIIDVQEESKNKFESTDPRLDDRGNAILAESINWRPDKFIKMLKQVYGTKPAKAEYSTVIYLKNEWQLSDAVINVIVYNTINATSEHFLNRNYVESTVVNLKQKKALDNPADTIFALHQRKNEINKVTNKKKSSGKIIEKEHKIDYESDEYKKLVDDMLKEYGDYNG